MTSNSNKPGTVFWIIAIIATIWNAMGVSAYLQQAYMTAEDIAALPAEEAALYDNVPAWVTAAFAIAVFGGLLGCILLLLRKKLATTVFLVSLIGIIVQMIYNLFMSKALDVYGPGGAIMPIMVILIGIFLWKYASKLTAKGVLN